MSALRMQAWRTEPAAWRLSRIPAETFALRENDKFGCVALDGVPLAKDLGEPIALGDGMWALFGNPLELGEPLRERMGSMWVARVERANLVLLVMAPSVSPTADDDEIQRLERLAVDSLLALMVLGVPQHGSAARMRGAVLTDGPWLSCIDRAGPFGRHPWAAPFEIDATRIQKSHDVLEGWEAVSTGGDSAYARLRKGLRAWMRAVTERGDMGEQLHSFVRSIEAIVKPRIARTMRDFKERLQLFIGRCPQSRALAGEIYSLRSAVEHLNPWEDVLAGYGTLGTKTIALERAAQAESITNHVWQCLLSIPSLLRSFRTDEDIDAFWSQNERERRAAWGGPLDLGAYVSTHYCPP